MKIGGMRERITILQPVMVEDEYGGRTTDWTETYSVWAKARIVSGAELFRVGAQLTTKRVEFITRYRADIDEEMRVSWRGETYNIVAVVPDEKRIYMTLQCEKAIGSNQ